jgi:hypothetical protein
MDPAPLSNWTALVIGIGGSLITGAIWFAALRVWMAKREWKEQAVDVELARVHLVQAEHSRTLGDLHGRVRVLENEIDLRPPPPDYARI